MVEDDTTYANFFLRRGREEFKEGLSRIKAQNYFISTDRFADAIAYFGLYQEEHPQDETVAATIDSLYGYWFLVNSINQNEKDKEFLEKALLENSCIYSIGVFIKHYTNSLLLFNGDSINGIDPDYCSAIQEFETILGNDAVFEQDSSFRKDLEAVRGRRIDHSMGLSNPAETVLKVKINY